MRRRSSNVAFIDFTTNFALVFVVLFILVAISLLPKKPVKEGIELSTDFVITMTWEDQNDDDVDLLIRDPAFNLLYYGKKDIGFMSLERDDRGVQMDIDRDASGNIVRYDGNREISTIRKAIAGTYVINVLMFAKRTPEPTKVNVSVMKIKPFKEIISRTYTLNSKGQQQTAIRMTLDEKGNVIDQDNVFEPIGVPQ